MIHVSFDEFFKAATGRTPYPFQRKFADDLHSLVQVPTGLGKTEMAVLGWLWRRMCADEGTRRKAPRRLVYCLPMRVLVEQTCSKVVEWLCRLGMLATRPGDDRPFDGWAARQGISGSRIGVHVLMGGEDPDDWDLYPEREAIIIGTQDMLLSRALNRGYGMSRFRWPMHFALLNNDCLWVFDEIQLMGAGLATTAQLEAFRQTLGSKDGHACRSVWMSATMQKDWLKAVDFAPQVAGLTTLELSDGDHENPEVKKRWEANKPIERAGATMDDAAKLADEIRNVHKVGTRTIVVVNTVQRACKLFDALNVAGEGGKGKSKGDKKKRDSSGALTATATLSPKIVLLHSRFRPGDRQQHFDDAFAEPDGTGTIIVSTQVIEAGVDKSATTLFTELAPWASLVQRFGRCNREGEANEDAAVRWINLPAKEPKGFVRLYELAELESARERLEKLSDVGLHSLRKVEVDLPFKHGQVVRRKDLVDLFDTTPDLAGNDIDIDRFVREVDETDVRVFWRTWDQGKDKTPPADAPAPRREELCPAPVGEFRQFAKKQGGKVWRWDFLDKRWGLVGRDKIAPGQVFLARADAGGYSPERGWDPSSSSVDPVGLAETGRAKAPEATDDDDLSHASGWQTIAQHTADVCGQIESILGAVPINEGDALRLGARWHDRGKAHTVFQDAIDDGQTVERKGKPVQRRERPPDWQSCRIVAKAPRERKDQNGNVVDMGFWRRYVRKHFRHEMASAMAALHPSSGISAEWRDLVAYLVAAHHGKVRLSIRSLPDERRPEHGGRFARGVWDGDPLPATALGDGTVAPECVLSLEPMEIGLCQEEPFRDQPSWIERMLKLRDTLGPFHLAFLETLLRAADMRASKKGSSA
jgi:CRISPR-associated endonuclease/helicase Cas3